MPTLTWSDINYKLTIPLLGQACGIKHKGLRPDGISFTAVEFKELLQRQIDGDSRLQQWLTLNLCLSFRLSHGEKNGS